MFKSLSVLALLAIAPFAAAQQQSVSPDQESKIASDLSTYLTHMTAQPAYTSFANQLITALPTSVLDEIVNDPNDFLQSALTASATPAWITALPSPLQSYLKSVGEAEQSIISKDLGNAGAAQPTGAVKIAAAAAGGVLGLAALL